MEAARGMDPACDVVYATHLSIDSLHASFGNAKFTAKQIMQSEFISVYSDKQPKNLNLVMQKETPKISQQKARNAL